MTSKKKYKTEKPLHSALFNILFPVLILKNGNKWLDKYLGDTESFQKWMDYLDYPSLVFAISLVFPLAYFIYDFISRKNINVISILGFINILLTGGIGIFGSKFGLTKNWFILKEGLLPLVIGFLLFLMSIFKKKSFHNIFLNELMFQTDKIKNAIGDNLKSEFDRVLQVTGYYFICGFIISSIIQFFLASIIVVSNPGDPSFNAEVSTMTWVSYIAVLLPTMIILAKGFMGLISGIEKLTGMKKEEFLNT
ncbi:MAG: hypothetical protein CBE24_05730 [bacterium TMED264]|nr:MAG: hypothetical protein CBE24_05730 [bacterium TMED264]